jgi:hypothetical protein
VYNFISFAVVSKIYYSLFRRDNLSKSNFEIKKQIEYIFLA